MRSRPRPPSHCLPVRLGLHATGGEGEGEEGGEIPIQYSVTLRLTQLCGMTCLEASNLRGYITKGVIELTLLSQPAFIAGS